MAGRRTGSVTGGGVVNIVFGALWMLCGACGVVGLAVGLGGESMLKENSAVKNDSALQAQLELQAELNREFPANRAIAFGLIFWNIIIGIAALILGISLLRLQNWARGGSIILAILVLVTVIGAVVFNLAVVGPETERARQAVVDKHPEMKDHLNPANAPGGAALQSLAFVGPVLEVAYAVTILILMLAPGTKAAFGPAVLAPDSADEGWGSAGRPDDGWGRQNRDDPGQGGFRAPDR